MNLRASCQEAGFTLSQVAAIDRHHFVITATARFAGKARTVVAEVLQDDQGTRVVKWQRLSG